MTAPILNISNTLVAKDIETIIYTSDEALNISKTQWESLSENSIFNNPFNSYTWLTEALKYFADSENIRIVAAWNQGELICLFPIIIKRKLCIFSYLEIWQPNHNFEFTPLIRSGVDFSSILKSACQTLKCQWAKIHLHNPKLIPETSNKRIYQDVYKRASINNTSCLNNYTPKGKFNRENRRLLKRANEHLELNFKEIDCIKTGLQEYIELERLGWKYTDKGAIANFSYIREFYENIISSSWGLKHIKIFGLYSKNCLIACAIRVETNDTYFEIKTSYHPEYKTYGAGRLLELYLLDELKIHKNIQVDSCTSQNNKLINRLWPDKLSLFSSTLFYSKSSFLLFYILRLIKRI